jgi:hypothetical protein
MKATALAFMSLLAGLVVSTSRAETGAYASVDVQSGPVVAAPVGVPMMPLPRYAPGYATVPPVRYEAPRGYWRDVTVRSWVPDRWIVTPGRHGRTVRVFEPGHFVCSTDRVWVESRRGDDFGRHMDRWNR